MKMLQKRRLTVRQLGSGGCRERGAHMVGDLMALFGDYG
jgi:hypothetical protein